MKTFIEYIADNITPEDLSNLKDTCYVFPSRRAGVYFNDVLQSKFHDATFWSPVILSIEDFVVSSFGAPVTDDITLLFDLYSSYRQFDKSIKIERFYAWGQVLLSDFEELDRYMADANKVYSSLKEIKDLELVFGDPEEVKNAIKEFQKIFSGKESVLVNRFIQNWEIIKKTYGAFNELLEREGKTYKGRAFRKLAERLRAGEANLPYKKIVFAGFNALSKSEEVIMTSLLKSGLAEVYFDSDKLYMLDPKEEAGDFLRHYKKNWNYKGVHWIETDLLQSNNRIKFIGCTQMVGQAKVTGTILKDIISNETDLQNTAVVLADESLLMPVLHALPGIVTDVNVTMGYPFRNTTIYSFISRVFKINIVRRENGKEISYPSEEIIGILKNTMISPVFPELTRKLSKIIRKRGARWISKDQIHLELGESWLEPIFIPAKDGLDLLDNIIVFLVRIFNYLKENEEDPSDREIIYHTLKNLNRFMDNIKKQKFDPDFGFVHTLFQETFRNLKIPFEGEPLNGMQIMGFLESRALDFNNVLVLGVNETKIPASHMGQSYLPFAVRKAFDMPTSDEQEAIYAYHFKRILQRSPNSYVLFNTEVAVDGSGEKSRFILQLLYKLQQLQLKSGNNTALQMETMIIKNPMFSIGDKVNTVVVEKTKEVLSLINERYAHSDLEKRKRLSPTSLVNYIDCKLRFYLKYLAKVPEEELIMEEIDPRVFGTIVHKVIEYLYRPYIGILLQKKDIEEMSGDSMIEKMLKKVLIEENIVGERDTLQGKDILVASVILKYVKKIILLDKRTTPFTIMGVEESIVSEMQLKNGKKISLGGVVDRIDQVKEGQVDIARIIDYKTGKIETIADSKAALEDAEEYLRPYFLDGKYKAGFQAYYYASLFGEQYPGTLIKAGIFSTRSVNDGIKFLRKGKTIDPQILVRFNEKLKELAEEIMDPEVPFVQTADTLKCRVCAYKAICRR